MTYLLLLFSMVFATTSLLLAFLWWKTQKKIQEFTKNLKLRNQLLMRRLRKEMLLRDINQVIRTNESLKEISLYTATLLGKLLKVDRCIIYNCNGHAEQQIMAEYTQKRQDSVSNLLASGKVDSVVFFEKSTLVQQTLRDIPTIVADDVKKADELAGLTETYRNMSVKSMMVTGAFFQEQLNGMIAVHQCDNLREWTPYEEEVLEGVAEQMALAIAIERAKLMREVIMSKVETERRAAELTRALEKEKQASELQSEFVSMVSHEFRTPLAIINTASQLLERNFLPLIGGEEAPKANKSIEKIQRSVERMVRLMDTTLNLSKLENGNISFTPVELNLKELVQDIVKRLQDLYPDAEISLYAETFPDIFKGDQQQLEQIFINLLTNAVKYSEPYAKVAISCKTIAHGFEISIGDNGRGIPEEDLPRMFEKFFRAKNSIGTAGTGIGLYLTKALVGLHNGKIRVESSLGQGTTFFVSFPFYSVN